MVRNCKKGKKARVLRNLEELEIYQHIYQQLDVGDIILCPFAIIEVKGTHHSFLTSARRLNCYNKKYVAISPYTGEYVFLTPYNFRFKCKKTGSRKCPQEPYVAQFKKEEIG